MITSRAGVIVAVVAVAATACGATAWLSGIPDATARCARCELPTILADVALEVMVETPCAPENCHMVKATATCDGVPCDVVIDDEDFGSRMSLTVTPHQAGVLAIDVVVNHSGYGETKRFRLGPYQVVVPDEIALRCQARAPTQPTWRPCDAGVAAGDDVRVEVTVHDDGRRLAGVEPVVEVTGAPPALELSCTASGLATGAGGFATVCVGREVPAGTHAVVATLVGLRRELTLTVAGAVTP